MKDDTIPDFSYAKIIKNPDAFGAGAEADDFSPDMAALKSYTDLLMTSDTKANCLQSSGHPLGDQYFLKTSATCINPTTKKPASRYIYISNQPEDSSEINPLNDANSSEGMKFNGLIPGIVHNMRRLNPFSIFSAFSQDGNPECVEVTLSSTRDLPGDICTNTNSRVKYNTHLITKSDAQKVDPCSFKTGINTYSTPNKYCKHKVEGFQTLASIPDDPLVFLYFSLCGLAGVYVLYRFLQKQRTK